LKATFGFQEAFILYFKNAYTALTNLSWALWEHHNKCRSVWLW